MKSFHWIVANSFLSVAASMLVWFSATIWAYLQTHSVLVTSILSATYLGGLILTSILFGSIVDHHRKRSVMLVADAISGSLFAVGFGLYAFLPPETLTDVRNPLLWVFLAVVFAGVIVANLRAIAVPTLVTLLVEDGSRDKANGLVGTVNGLAFLICPMLGGFLIAVSGMYWILLIAIALRLVTIGHLALTHVAEDIPATAHLLPEHKKIDLKGTFKAVHAVPGLLALMIFNCLNNFLAGVFMPLVDPYGLSFVDQRAWGVISGLMSIGFIVGGLMIAKYGLGPNPLRRLFLTNVFTWMMCVVMAIQPSLLLLILGVVAYFICAPSMEAAEQTIIQRVVPAERQGRVFGFAQSLEQAASPVSTLAVGPLTQFAFIPFMTTGAGVATIGGWFGTGESRGIALAFVCAGLIGLAFTLAAMQSKSYRVLAEHSRRP